MHSICIEAKQLHIKFATNYEYYKGIITKNLNLINRLIINSMSL